MLRKGALKIAKGESDFFTFKSGRRSPNFINIGALSDGESSAFLGRAFAQAAMEGVESGKIGEFDYVFGPAYKGIPIAALTCSALFEKFGKNASLLYDRKEEKAYGDASADKAIVGAGAWRKGGKILLVDDVITTGKAKYDSLEKLKALEGFEIAGMVIAVDRMEKSGDAENVGPLTAVQTLEKELGIRTVSIITMHDIFSQVKGTLSPAVLSAWEQYWRKYCA